MAEENSRSRGARRIRHLMEELQEEILVRLPVESLIRFESVCKTWLSKFRSHPFIDLYAIRRRVNDSSKYSLEFYTSPSLLKMAPGPRKPLLPPYKFGEYWSDVVGLLGPLSNGIYCLTDHIREAVRDFFSIFSGQIALCNPSTRRYKVANHFPSDLYSLLSDNIIASKPCRAYFGCGKINSTSDYKVVVILNYGDSLSSFISLVYSLQSGEWKKIVEYGLGKRPVGDGKATEAFTMQGRRITCISYPLEPCPQRFLEGCWHWVVLCENRSFNVLSFNFADEAFKLIGGPPLPSMDYALKHRCDRKAAVFVLHGHLAFIYICTITFGVLSQYVSEVDVWMMMEYGVEESWTRVCNKNPNFHGDILTLLEIEYRLLRDEESGGICIESLSFGDHNHRKIICSNDVGYQVCGRWDFTEISTHIETLERL